MPHAETEASHIYKLLYSFLQFQLTVYLAPKNIMLRSASYTDFFVLEDKIIQYIKLSSDKIRTSDWSVGVDETKSNIP